MIKEELEVRAYIFTFTGGKVLLKKINEEWMPFNPKIRYDKTPEKVLVEGAKRNLEYEIEVLRSNQDFYVARISKPKYPKRDYFPKDYGWFTKGGLKRKDIHIPDEIKTEITKAYKIFQERRGK